jgi:hypothetical protein
MKNIQLLKKKSYILTILYIFGLAGFFYFKEPTIKLLDFLLTAIIFVILMNIRNKILFLSLSKTMQEIIEDNKQYNNNEHKKNNYEKAFHN